MQVHTDINNLPFFNNAVVTIGTFDGVHTGHLKIINQLKKEAKAINGESVIITFHPHPRIVIGKPSSASGKADEKVKLLNTLPEKTELLANQNIDHLVIVRFTLEFSEQTAEEYIKDFLVSRFHPHTIIIGYDHRFGKNRAGDYHLLEECQQTFNYKVKEIPEHVLNDVIISSTRIRHSLAEGNIADANEALGYPYSFEGNVVEGNKLGRTLGYPTANIELRDKYKVVPGNGVYAVKVSLDDDSLTNNHADDHTSVYYNGMMNIGTRPTVGGTKKVIEVNIFDFDKSIYNTTLRIYIKGFLRPEVKFNGLEELKLQLSSDKKNAETILRALNSRIHP
ncbi:MAG: bifunctional riboflavin kinase/FAD synthetase [Ginsengibacter sp.]